MTDALSAMEYPHWLIVAGAILVVFGFIGLAFRQRLAPIEPEKIDQLRPPQKATIGLAKVVPRGKRQPKISGMIKNPRRRLGSPPTTICEM